MTPEEFNQWVKDMKAAKLAKSRNECAKLLGISTTSAANMSKKGCDHRTALACKALLHRLNTI